jgi:hypothetical protein
MKPLVPALAALMLASAVPPVAAAEAPAMLQLASAQQDDAGFLFILGLMEGHLAIGHELIQADKPKLGLPHFGHPVRELYDDLRDELAKRHVADFEDALADLEAAVAKAPRAAETEAKYQAVVAAVARARASVPASVRQSVPEMIKICADTLEAAAGEYGEAIDKGRLENLGEYHDSRGFVGAVTRQVAELENGNPAAQDAEMIGRFKAVLAKVQAIVAPLLPPSTPPKSAAEYRAIAHEAQAVVQPR